MQTVELLKNWLFQQNDHAPVPVTIPHDWAINGLFDRNNDLQITHIVQNGEMTDAEHSGRTGGLPHVGKGKYSCLIAGPSACGKRVYLLFDGVMSHAKVYLNGKAAGSCNYGFTSFVTDATGYLHSGANLLEVTAENYPYSARSYPGAGIYRPVYRIEKDPVHFQHWSIHLQYLPARKALLLQGVIENYTGKAVSGTLILESPIFTHREIQVSVPPAGVAWREEVGLLPAELWDIDNPHLYNVSVSIRSMDFSDNENIMFGLREFKFDKDHGFFLNGKRIKINGVCLHHDLGPLGAAFHAAAARRQLLMLKKMGCNAIRTSHNPPAPQLLDLCDELGFLVMDEAFDCWRNGKVKNDYSIHFDTDAEKDLSTMICRDRNHPCVILWSIGNELMEIRDKTLRGDLIAEHLVSTIKKYDSERPVTAGLDACEMAIESGIADQLDIPSWNYRPQSYAEYHRRFPDCPVIASETLSTLSSRGIYYFPAREYVFGRHQERPEVERGQCSSYCLDIPAWAHVPEAEFMMQDEYEFVAGQFIWTGFDYLGEPFPYETRWPSRSSYFGCIDLVGLPKDLFYVIKAQWQKKGEPFLHIIPAHWNWEKGKIFDIHVVSNCRQVELLVNDLSLGKISPSAGSSVLTERYRFIWHDVKYVPGTICAVGYRDGKVCSREIINTAGSPSKLKLETERNCCRNDGEDMIFVTVSVTDTEGNLCPAGNMPVKFSLIGKSLKLLAADGGNPASTEPFYLPECTLFSGKAVVFLQSTGIKGETLLVADSNGLESAEMVLQTSPGATG